jgi:hypothetical protein
MNDFGLLYYHQLYRSGDSRYMNIDSPQFKELVSLSWNGCSSDDPNYYNIISAMCGNCPWREYGGIFADDPDFIEDMRQTMQSHTCHSLGFLGTKQDKICRPSRNRQIEVLVEFGVLGEPTDKAFEEFWSKLSNAERLNLVQKIYDAGLAYSLFNRFL